MMSTARDHRNQAGMLAKKMRESQIGTADSLGVSIKKTIELGEATIMEFMLVPAGKFYMGSPQSENERDDDEGPVHLVKIDKAFYIGTYQVTQAQYEILTKDNPSLFRGQRRPVERVSWKDAVVYCEQLSCTQGKCFRLPTEAEWEHACRAGTGTKYNVGDNLEALSRGAWCSYHGRWGNAKETKPVGGFCPNNFGLYDMHGNVWEWCLDWYDADYYCKSPTSDPTGPINGIYRVLRGGSWGDAPEKCRSAYRTGSPPEARNFNKGFRIVMNL